MENTDKKLDAIMNVLEKIEKEQCIKSGATWLSSKKQLEEKFIGMKCDRWTEPRSLWETDWSVWC